MNMNVDLFRAEIQALLRFIETADNDKFAENILTDEGIHWDFRNAVWRLKTALDQDIYVNVYAVTRHYGGPEEGGWWYNAGELLESVACHPELADAKRTELEAKYADRKEGNIYSVLGGVDIDVQISDKEGADFPVTTPHYE